MKLVAFIMAMVVLGLSLSPCSDSALPENDHLHASVTIAHDSPYNNEPDLCTPFCSCTCCCSISLFKNLTEQNRLSVQHIISHSSMYLGSLSEIAMPVWQPPQLVA